MKHLPETIEALKREIDWGLQEGWEIVQFLKRGEYVVTVMTKDPSTNLKIGRMLKPLNEES